MIAFALGGALAGFGGVLLDGYAGKAAQSMGAPIVAVHRRRRVAAPRSGGAADTSAPSPASIFITLCRRYCGEPDAAVRSQIIYGIIIVYMQLCTDGNESCGEGDECADQKTVRAVVQ